MKSVRRRARRRFLVRHSRAIGACRLEWRGYPRLTGILIAQVHTEVFRREGVVIVYDIDEAL